jgi:hypothetical protein
MRSGTREHVRAKIAAQREDGCQVDLEDFVPVAGGELVRWVTPLDPRAGDQDRDVVAVREDLGCQAGDVGL